MKKQWIKYLCAAAAVIGLIIVVIYRQESGPRYFYKDYFGNIGTADRCEETVAGLICYGKYDKKVMVTAYWKGRK